MATRTYRLRHRSKGSFTEFAWIWDATGELRSPIFNSAEEAQAWIGQQLGRIITVQQ